MLMSMLNLETKRQKAGSDFMPNMKDYFNNDLDVFINNYDFSDNHTIDKRTLSIIVDNDRLMHRSKKEYDGITVGEILYFVKKSDFGARPEEGTPQIFDGRQMYVFNVREDNGMYEILLSQNRGG